MRAFPESRPLTWKSEVLLHIERSRKWINWKHIKVLLAIVRCRTAVLGGHLDECTRCGHRVISFNSAHHTPSENRSTKSADGGWRQRRPGSNARNPRERKRKQKEQTEKEKNALDSYRHFYWIYEQVMAERVGFEPTVRFPVRSLSRRVLSTAQSPLRGRY